MIKYPESLEFVEVDGIKIPVNLFKTTVGEKTIWRIDMGKYSLNFQIKLFDAIVAKYGKQSIKTKQL